MKFIFRSIRPSTWTASPSSSGGPTRSSTRTAVSCVRPEMRKVIFFIACLTCLTCLTCISCFRPETRKVIFFIGCLTCLTCLTCISCFRPDKNNFNCPTCLSVLVFRLSSVYPEKKIQLSFFSFCSVNCHTRLSFFSTSFLVFVPKNNVIRE